MYICIYAYVYIHKNIYIYMYMYIYKFTKVYLYLCLKKLYAKRYKNISVIFCVFREKPVFRTIFELVFKRLSYEL